MSSCLLKKCLFLILSIFLFINSNSGYTVTIIPVNNRAYFKTLLNLINQAQDSIEIAELTWKYDYYAVRQIQLALKKAVKRKVKVRILLDGKLTQYNNMRSAYYLRKYGCRTKIYTRFRLLHCKLVIIDKLKVLLGSTNISKSSLFYNNETNLLIISKPIALYFFNYFEKLWNNKSGLKYIQPFTYKNITVFTEASFLDILLEVLQNAKKEVYIIMYYIYFTESKKLSPVKLFYNTINALLDKKVKIRVILEANLEYNHYINRSNNLYMNRLVKKGAICAKDPEDVITHCKLIIADDTVLITSSNIKNKGLNYNRQIGVVVRDEKLAYIYKHYFYKLLKKSKLVKWQKTLKYE